MKRRPILITAAFIFISVLSLLLVPIIAAQDATLEGEGQFIRVTVQLNDSLAKYASVYGVSGSAMLAVNNLSNPDMIFPGQTIIIPVIKTQTPSLTTPFFYVAQTGDTLTSVGRQFHQDGFNIGFANSSFVEALVPGRVYLIPAGPHYEIVQKGEHLGLIAVRYGVTIDFLQRANGGIDPVQLFIGQRINVPILFDARPIPIPPPPVTATPGPGVTFAPFVIVPDTATPIPTATATPLVFPTRTPKPTATSIALSNNFITVVVQFNESLVTYVYRYGVSGSAMLAVNPKLQVNPDLLFPGDVITIPVVISFTPSRSTPFFYTVQSGDTVFTIADKFELSSDTLIAGNPKATFAAGTTVLIPAGPHYEIVQKGEHLGLIAVRYGVTIDFLQRA
ncbi:MAG TPA: LysM peptidoglycan-binding domain-containing protein, partial [Anaerolineales bacterium]|nr:LysM peptidoglycan-binding domain-containing protein [Anaerolineales bacterium]